MLDFPFIYIPGVYLSERIVWYHIGNQRRSRCACAWAQTHQILHCLHTNMRHWYISQMQSTKAEPFLCISTVLSESWLLDCILYVYGSKLRPNVSPVDSQNSSTISADPESFVRGGLVHLWQRNVVFFCLFLSSWGERIQRSKYHLKWAIIGQPAKRHLNAGLVALWF